ncbi:hypothetical protein [Natrarchaeobius chitinivorans]|uniref:Uncharacterized protein n=1 Tax=Natrarchaeobius chitinivorans TaxID=1679083 RepID=A0A3N6MK52_NATCH|nr:hypothetical protein [Natrarchaeobius chitinivorans]RQG94626.1 hypothetical protein EA473_11115 [Natrarchaeobius chitinivorans]
MRRRTLIVGSATFSAISGCLLDDEGDAKAPELHGIGRLEIVIDGSPVDLSEDRFQAEHADNYSMDFHFHEETDFWYMEGEEPVTFAEGIDAIPYFEYRQDAGAHVVTYDGTAYHGDESGTELRFRVDDDEVEPTEYVLEDGDDLLLEISTGG